ncbi:MAG TPA: uridine kinase [Polyangiaceae bacterium]|nr:uridine kinase [Polyangiaceae bacterium]
MLRCKPFFVGIAGGTGSGKTTVARNLKEALRDGDAIIIDHDAYYKDRSMLPPDERDRQNFDHPDALDNDLLVRHLDALAEGKPIEMPIYDFVTHTRQKSAKPVEPVPVIIVEGILIFADVEIRRRFDIKVFVDTDADLRVFRRVRRDIEARGRTFAQVDEQYHRTVRPMHIEFVEPSKRFADVVIPEGGDNHVAMDLLATKLRNVTVSASQSQSI